MKGIEKYSSVLLIVILVSAFFFRLWNIDQNSYYADYDTYFTAKRVAGIYEEKIGNDAFLNIPDLHSDSFAERLADANSDGGNSFSYNILLHYYSAVFGHQDYTLRIFSVLFDVLSILLIWLIGKKWNIPPSRILLACAFYAVFPLLASFAGVIRTYAFTTSMCLLLFYWIIRVKENGPRIKDIILISLTAAIIFLGHFLTYYILGVLFVYFLFTLKKDKYRNTTIIAGLSVAGIVCAGFLLYNLKNVSRFNDKNERFQEMTTQESGEGNTRNLKEVSFSTITPKLISYFNQFYVGNGYVLNVVQGAVGGNYKLIAGGLLLIAPLLLFFFLKVPDDKKKWVRLIFFLLIAGHLSAILFTLAAGHMLPLRNKYTMFTIPFYILMVCFFVRFNFWTVVTLCVIIVGSCLSSVHIMSQRGQNVLPIHFDGEDKNYNCSQVEEALAKVQDIVNNGDNDTLFVHTKQELVFIEMTGFNKNRSVAYILAGDSTGQFGSRVLPFSYSTPQ